MDKKVNIVHNELWLIQAMSIPSLIFNDPERFAGLDYKIQQDEF